MKIPVFVSCPTTLSPAQDASRALILRELDNLELEPRAVGRSDYPVDSPLREVFVLARHCSGGVILGYSQVTVTDGINKPGTQHEVPLSGVKLPTPWNHVEAGILFALGLPLLVFREDRVSGGIFDLGAGDVFVQRMPVSEDNASTLTDLRGVFLRWQARVREHYYRF